MCKMKAIRNGKVGTNSVGAGGIIERNNSRNSVGKGIILNPCIAKRIVLLLLRNISHSYM